MWITSRLKPIIPKTSISSNWIKLLITRWPPSHHDIPKVQPYNSKFDRIVIQNNMIHGGHTLPFSILMSLINMLNPILIILLLLPNILS